MAEIDLTGKINAVLQGYNLQINGKIKTAARSVSQDAVKKLKAESPKSGGHTKYARSWAVYQNENSAVDTNCVIHNVKHYRLTHLLEKGTASRATRKDANRGSGPAMPHIKNVEEWAVNEFVKKTEEIINGGG